MKETVHLPLVVDTDDSMTLTWNIDASFAVHPDYKSHTGGCLTLGHGSVLFLSTKQMINIKSSTEAKRVGVDEAMTFVMRIKHFFKSQVSSVDVNYPLKPLGSDVTIEQDNKSTIKLEWKG